MPPSDKSDTILGAKSATVTTPVVIQDEFRVNIDMDRAFFGPYPVPDWFLVVNTRELKKSGCRNWPPVRWESENAPRDDSWEAIKRWFDLYLHPVGVLVCLESFDRSGRRRISQGERTPVDRGKAVRDAWRLVRHLNFVGKTKIEVKERPGRYDAHEALIELESIYNQLSSFFVPAQADVGIRPAEGKRTDKNQQPPKQRGRKRKGNHKQEEEIAKAWQRARDNGKRKKDFVADNDYGITSVKQLNRILDRVRHFNSRHRQ